MLHNRYFIVFFKYFLAVSISAVTVVLIRKAIPYILPLILATATALLLQPLVKHLCHSYGFMQKYASIFVITSFFAVILTVFILIATYIFHQIYGFFGDLPILFSDLPSVISRLRQKIETLIGTFSLPSREYIREFFNSSIEKFSDLPANVSAYVLSLLPHILDLAPKAFIFIGTYLIGTYFVSLSFGDITDFLKRQIPSAAMFKIHELKTSLKASILKWLKAEFIIMGFTFLQLTASLTVLKVPYSMLLAMAISLVDALPILGIGTVLLPWSAYCFITGANSLGIGLAATYGVVSVLRNIIEPKVVGHHIGFPPVVTLFAIYIGYKLFGFFGIILTPITLIITKELNTHGYIRLWK